jgi:hypothetical protein
LCTFVSLAYLNNVNCSLLQLVWSLGLWAWCTWSILMIQRG